MRKTWVFKHHDQTPRVGEWQPTSSSDVGRVLKQGIAQDQRPSIAFSVGVQMGAVEKRPVSGRNKNMKMRIVYQNVGTLKIPLI